ncbi:hypothetical protein CYMTET_43537 [Cymbomonas tetramitiformis]|uniref:Uncharacterized protein n=1 Tax=Cymbomonas tetramitiformis TaxID=36881 RepID=A0AAE0C391_9CHLO|nr:hypothetical protein CYMTET_43537 [Cymbomonas tetramitiformis]
MATLSGLIAPAPRSCVAREARTSDLPCCSTSLTGSHKTREASLVMRHSTPLNRRYTLPQRSLPSRLTTECKVAGSNSGLWTDGSEEFFTAAMNGIIPALREAPFLHYVTDTGFRHEPVPSCTTEAWSNLKPDREGNTKAMFLVQRIAQPAAEPRAPAEETVESSPSHTEPPVQSRWHGLPPRVNRSRAAATAPHTPAGRWKSLPPRRRPGRARGDGQKRAATVNYLPMNEEACCGKPGNKFVAGAVGECCTHEFEEHEAPMTKWSSKTEVWGVVIQSTDFNDHDGCYMLTTTSSVSGDCTCIRYTLSPASCGGGLSQQLEDIWLRPTDAKICA